MICRHCGTPNVQWVGSLLRELDGAIHWDICKQRQYFMFRAFGEPYIAADEAGYIYNGKRGPLWKRGPTITGSKFNGTCHCNTPPWEECEHKFAA